MSRAHSFVMKNEGVQQTLKTMDESNLPILDEKESDGLSRRPKKTLLTEAEACEFLRISRVGILKLKRDKVDPIPCLKVGRRYLYEPNEVLRWAKRQAERAQKIFK